MVESAQLVGALPTRLVGLFKQVIVDYVLETGENYGRDDLYGCANGLFGMVTPTRIKI